MPAAPSLPNPLQANLDMGRLFDRIREGAGDPTFFVFDPALLASLHDELILAGIGVELVCCSGDHDQYKSSRRLSTEVALAFNGVLWGRSGKTSRAKIQRAIYERIASKNGFTAISQAQFMWSTEHDDVPRAGGLTQQQLAGFIQEEISRAQQAELDQSSSWGWRGAQISQALSLSGETSEGVRWNSTLFNKLPK